MERVRAQVSKVYDWSLSASARTRALGSVVSPRKYVSVMRWHAWGRLQSTRSFVRVPLCAGNTGNPQLRIKQRETRTATLVVFNFCTWCDLDMEHVGCLPLRTRDLESPVALYRIELKCLLDGSLQGTRTDGQRSPVPVFVRERALGGVP